MRMTKQREIILETLRSVSCHPTADEIYDWVRKDIPNISLGTVYRNLETLSDSGIILKVQAAGTQMRFDGDISPHFHFRCRECGRVSDLEFSDKQWLGKLTPQLDCKIEGADFFGVCKDCLN